MTGKRKGASNRKRDAKGQRKERMAAKPDTAGTTGFDLYHAIALQELLDENNKRLRSVDIPFRMRQETGIASL